MAADDKNDFVELLQNFRQSLPDSVPVESKTVSPLVSRDWGYDHTDELFNSMLSDRNNLKTLMREAIVEPIDFKNIACLFSRYTCFKFFERHAISFWRSSQLLDISQLEVVDYFPIMEVRALFGSKNMESLLEKFLKFHPNASLQEFSNSCADYNISHSEERKTMLQADFVKPSWKRLFIHFFKKKDLGVNKKSASSSVPVENKNEQKRIRISSPSPARTPPLKMPRLSTETTPNEPTRRSLRKQQQNEKCAEETAEDQDVFMFVGRDGEQRLVDLDSDADKTKDDSKKVKKSDKTKKQSDLDLLEKLPVPIGAASDEMPVLPSFSQESPNIAEKKHKSYSKKNRQDDIKHEIKEEIKSDVDLSQVNSEECSEADEIPEIPAFSLADLKRFEDEADPYVVYALTFACFELNRVRMQRVADVLLRETGQSSLHNADSDQNKILLEQMVEKLRLFMGFFVPKTFPLTSDKIRAMSVEELSVVDLAEFGKACEAEFSRLLEDRRRALREKFDSQFNRMKELFVRFVQKFQPELTLNENVNVKEMEQIILKSLKSENGFDHKDAKYSPPSAPNSQNVDGD